MCTARCSLQSFICSRLQALCLYFLTVVLKSQMDKLLLNGRPHGFSSADRVSTHLDLLNSNRLIVTCGPLGNLVGSQAASPRKARGELVRDAYTNLHMA